MDWSEIQDKDLIQACSRYGEYFFNNTKTFKYTPFEPIYQQGPTCGLTALGMYLKLGTDEKIKNIILNEAKNMEYSLKGEMFSCRSMYNLTKNFIDKKVELYNGYLSCDTIIKFLLNGGIMLVPYDSDANHEPCVKNGHKAHWALVSGIIITSSVGVYVLARQGKSKMLGLWSLELLAASNAQLNEVAPERTSPNEYILPKGGLSSEDGLCNQAVLIYES